MLELHPVATDDPRAQTLLAEYFGLRADEFPGGNYRPTFPDPASFTPPAGIFLIAVDPQPTTDISDVGCGGIRRIPDGERGSRYEVKHLFLRPQTRGRGWGRALVEALEDRAREFGAHELVLDTHHSLTAAGALYERLGYAPIPRYNDNPNATVWLGKALV